MTRERGYRTFGAGGTPAKYGKTTDGFFCMCCGDDASLAESDQGYSRCCNDRITSDPLDHPDNEAEGAA